MINKTNKKVILIADMDLSRYSGEVIRTVAFANELKNNGLDVTILTSKPSNSKIIFNQGINFIHTSVKNEGGSIINIIKRTKAIIKKAKELSEDNIYMIETSHLGGYFALSRFSSYLLDIHGIYYSEIDYDSLPFYIPKCIYRKFTRFLEKTASKNADKVITVSDAMSDFVIKEFGVDENKVTVIPNGYFDRKIKEIFQKNIEEEPNTITFVGNLAKWANVDKIIRAAKKLENEEIKFIIVGDGTDRTNLEKLVMEYKLNNVFFTGRIPLDEAYMMIAKSEIMLLPFSNELCNSVACPIKVLEYMAFAKPMVIDRVDDISNLLEIKNAALVCDPNDEDEFVEKIRLLIHDKEIKEKIGYNAHLFSKEFSWKEQGYKLVSLLEELYEE